MGITYFITGNQKKFAEAKNIMPNLELLDIELDEIQEADPRKIIEAKLKSAFRHKSGEFVVEDTSLYMDCLDGKLPGPLIKWFLNTIGNNGLYEIVHKFNNYNAEVRTIVGYARSENEIHFFEGVVKGIIVKPEVAPKFGWDPIFKPHGFEMTYAEMSMEEKNAISQRGIAFRKLRDFLSKK